nr:rhodanese-like domain-containing protein [Alcanivorax sp. S6407]
MNPEPLSATCKTSTDSEVREVKIFQWLPLGKVPEVAPTQLYHRLSEVQIVDVRTRREFLSGHIPGARHLAITDFRRHAIEALALDPNRPVVAICRSAHRSLPATRQLEAMGFNASQLAGGMLEWKAQGLPLQKTGDPEYRKAQPSSSAKDSSK